MNSIRRHASRLIMGRMLPALRFFEPTEAFLRWMKRRYGSSLVYDVGAGFGHVAKLLSEEGLTVLAIDLNRRDVEAFPVLVADGECHEYEPGSVVMICRPCHGKFAGEVISQAERRRAAAVVYVGLEHNLDADLGIHRSLFTPALRDAGGEGEGAWTAEFPRGT